jgi:hypothetical protein
VHDAHYDILKSFAVRRPALSVSEEQVGRPDERGGERRDVRGGIGDVVEAAGGSFTMSYASVVITATPARPA